PGPDNACRLLHERFLSVAAEVSSLQQAPTVVNIHPAAAGSDHSRRELVDRSVSFFSWARQWCRQNARQVRVCAELQISPNPDEPIIRIGETYDELLEVVTRSRVRACWDFGHAYMNHLRYGVPLYPSQEFLPHVGHVHCHDVCGDDHHPLMYDAVPWKEFIPLLIESGYCGGIILEIFPWNLTAAGGITSLTESFNAVKTHIELCKRGTQAD
ncbi:MAG: sugar phosphate isomerase/epimerase family protein, partial [Planctomycetota bacterium]